MTIFILGVAIFFGSHLWTALARKRRDGLVAKLGAGPYKGLYSLVALAGFVLIVIGWRSADTTILYTTPGWMRHVTYLLMLVALVLLASAYLPAGRIAAAAKHPMLAAVKIWAFAHLLVNGDVRSVILFGSFLAFAVLDRIVVKKRGEATPAAGPASNDAIAVAVGAAAWAAIFFVLHPYISGVALH
jgi:uncharacterized membrane protein